ncbi:hypothetical protein [Agrobacterium larrymoorei]|uniref:Uncharacterized protein n=1 Tax=Agrobacterium larrymoorei TaxID=160699 RepID=A0AAF0KDB1_9HYPH|nr:hypothetical protein [Agrobacterium larrymoorei]WHA40586.1 hypothetical protein CFBP5477_012250 [Agrobacterium larrymoorei]
MTAAAERIVAPSRNARETLPRSLVGRRQEAFFLDLLDSIDPPRFSVGDIITFDKESGRRYILTILGFRGESVDIMLYDGRPYWYVIDEDKLTTLRIIRTETMPAGDVAMYRDLLGLDRVMQ